MLMSQCPAQRIFHTSTEGWVAQESFQGRWLDAPELLKHLPEHTDGFTGFAVWHTSKDGWLMGRWKGENQGWERIVCIDTGSWAMDTQGWAESAYTSEEAWENIDHAMRRSLQVLNEETGEYEFMAE